MSTAAPQNVADLLLHAARQHPDSGIRYCLGGSVAEYRDQNYAELLDDALRLLGTLRAQGMRAQDKVVLILEEPQDFLTAFWAAVLGGFVPCPVVPLRGDPDRWAAQLAHVDRLLDHPLVVTSEALAVELPPMERLLTLSSDLPAEVPPATPCTARPQDPAVLMLTSASTGAAKAVVLSHANLLASMAGKNETHRLTAADTTLNWVSFDHVAALLECHLLPLSTGSRQLHVAAPIVLGEPLEFLRLIARHGVTMSFAPNFLLGLLNAAAPRLSRTGEHLDLSPVRQIISGGEAVVRTTAEAFLDAYAPHGLARDALWPAFGMTETCAGSIYSRVALPDVDRGREFAGLGTPITGVHIRIADPDDRALPPGQVGELQLSGPVITPGYYNNEQATQDAFTADGWLRSGDLGRIDEGRLALVGRSKDSVIVNGVNYFSHDLESVLETLEGVAGSYCAAFPVRPEGSDTEQLVVAFHPEVPDGDDAALHRVLTAVRAGVVGHWGFRPALVLPLPKDAFPKTSLGKIQRALMRDRLASGAYDAARRAVAELSTRMLGHHITPEGPAEQAVAEVYAELFGIEPGAVGATANFFDLGGTSLDILRLCSRLAERFGGARPEVVSVLKAPTVRALAAGLTERELPGPAEYDPLVPLHTGGTRTPLFCVHPGVGEVLVFVGLAQYFVGDRPFYALRARGFGAGEKPFVTFDEMVDCYTRAIRDRQPQGPYAVAGYSFGAAVAFEIAKRLTSQGERVDFVGSFNLPPHIKYRMEELDFAETAVNLAFFLGLIDKRQSLELPARLRGLPVDEQLARLLDVASPQRLASLQLDEEKFGNWAELADSLTDLGRGYEPSGKVPSVSVFCATPLRGTKEDWVRDELRRWDEYATGPNRYIDVPGEHYTLMGPRHVAAFQGILRRELDRALEEADGAAAERAARRPQDSQ
ncbi:non-ribosomal peptide synthetase [Streptomyces broussonetiae]|uniref:AMP-binding protein n=1 Tax=Streptomyces broussonetiae TaxID=2686304 RepID=A0A6I6N1J8_9ACTN|nr:non-ribosomal peptide synthetase [Streptomyces broussonetiae]QHA06583.1 AMP-binding protein [Streptomyces broussonetiae]